MASVHLARTTAGGRPVEVALKVLSPEVAGGARAARFEREVASAARLAHPGCIRQLDHGRSRRGELYLVTELLRGPTLRSVLSARGRMPIGWAASVGRQLCEALAHAHDAGVLHRDVKPENVMFRDAADGDAVLIDFGLSSLRGEAALTAAGTCVGSPSYLAPERLLDRPDDARADLYAVGVVLYEILCGRPPFVGEHPLDIARQHLLDLPRRVEARRPDVPAALAAIVHCALEKEPSRRFARADTMAAALEGFEASASDIGDTGDSGDLGEIPAEWVELEASDSMTGSLPVPHQR